MITVSRALPCFIQAFGRCDEVLYRNKLRWNFLHLLKFLSQSLLHHLLPPRIHFLLLFGLRSYKNQSKAQFDNVLSTHIGLGQHCVAGSWIPQGSRCLQCHHWGEPRTRCSTMFSQQEAENNTQHKNANENMWGMWAASACCLGNLSSLTCN